jgi:hypothetical protein
MSYSIDWRRLLDAGWWQWVATIPLLAAHVSLGPERARPSFELATILCAAMALYASWRIRDGRAIAVQVRLTFLAFLVLGLPPAARWIHWLPLAGMTSMVTIGYCPLARMLALMPWNREEPLTAGLVGRTFLSRPSGGGILRRNGVQSGSSEQGRTSCADASACGIPLGTEFGRYSGAGAKLAASGKKR